MHRRCALLGLLALLPALTGCWDMRELEESNYVMAIGVDKGKKERFAVTFVLSRPNGAAEGGEGDKKGQGGEKGGDNQITVESPTISGATFYLNTVISRPSSLAQTKLILLSEELVRSEGMVILDEAGRSRNVRRSTMLVVTKEPVQEFLKNLPPGPEGLNDFAFLHTSDEARRSGYLPVRTSLNDFLIRASTAYQEPVAYYAAIASGDSKEKSKGKDEQSGGEKEESGEQGEDPKKKKGLVPGVSRRKGGPKVDFFGTAAFRQTKMVGALDAPDTRAMLMVQNSFTQSTIELIDEKDPKKSGSVRISVGRPTRIKANLVDGRPQFQILITLEGEVVGMPMAVDYTQGEARDQLEAQVAAKVKEQVETFFKKTQEWKADVGGLGRHIVRKFPTVDAWEAFNWPDKYANAQIQVSVQMKLRRFGVQLSPQPQGSREKVE